MTMPFSGPALSVASENPLAERVRELEEALRFYADPATYEDVIYSQDEVPTEDGKDYYVETFYTTLAKQDEGQKARIALGLEQARPPDPPDTRTFKELVDAWREADARNQEAIERLHRTIIEGME